MEAVVKLLNLRDIPEFDSVTRVEIYEGERKPFNVESDEKAIIISDDSLVQIEFETIKSPKNIYGALVVYENFSIKTLSKKSLVFVIKIKKTKLHLRDEVFDYLS